MTSRRKVLRGIKLPETLCLRRAYLLMDSQISGQNSNIEKNSKEAGLVGKGFGGNAATEVCMTVDPNGNFYYSINYN